MSETEDDISPLAMSIMASVASGRGLPRHVSHREVARLSDYEALVIDKAIRNQGRQLWNDQANDEFIIRDDER
jgi:hypothetical protein